MTFFNKKTEVMQIEMTPYGRYLYSIGKFKPHSYEFIDDDVMYKAVGKPISVKLEAQESAHNRIVNETPKLKINRAFQEEAPQVETPPRISTQRVMKKKNNKRQSDLYSLGRSSYSSDNMPSFQVSMLRGEISNSQMTNADYASVFIPQIDINFNIDATLKDTLLEPNENASEGGALTSNTFENGKYVSISYDMPIIHLKEFNSFYEKENFEIEIFLIQNGDELSPLKIEKDSPIIVNDMLIDTEPDLLRLVERESDFMEYFFDIEVDRDIDLIDLCKVVENLEINNQFLDEELICPDQRTDRFDIYATRVSPQDLEDCDD